MAEAPHFRLPFRVVGRGARVVEQDSLEEIAQCVYAVLATEPGSREEEPDFGLDDQAFRMGGADLDHFQEIVSQYEPRARLLPTAVWEDLLQRVTVETRRNDETEVAT